MLYEEAKKFSLLRKIIEMINDKNYLLSLADVSHANKAWITKWKILEFQKYSPRKQTNKEE